MASAIAVLSVTTDDSRAAHELQQARREAHLDELARRQTAASLWFLREECFDNPASARLFLMLNTTARLGVFPTTHQADDIVAEVTRWNPDASSGSKSPEPCRPRWGHCPLAKPTNCRGSWRPPSTAPATPTKPAPSTTCVPARDRGSRDRPGENHGR